MACLWRLRLLDGEANSGAHGRAYERAQGRALLGSHGRADDSSLLRSERNLTKYTRRETDAGQNNKNKKTQAGDWNSVAGDRVRVGPRAVVKLPYVVQGNDVLRWEFCVRAHDVRFSVSERRMASGGAVEVGLLPSATFAAVRVRCQPESIPSC